MKTLPVASAITALLLSTLALAESIPSLPDTAPQVLPILPVVGPLQFVIANWQNILLLILAVDAALIPLFPQVQILVKLKNLLAAIKNPAPPTT